MNALTLEGIDVEALVLRRKHRVLEAPFEQTALRVVRGDDLVALSLRVQLSRNYQHRVDLSSVLWNGGVRCYSTAC